MLITVKRTNPQIAKWLIRKCVSHNYLLRTHNFMNICSIIDNKISYCYFFMFLEQSEHILQLFAFSCVGWFCCRLTTQNTPPIDLHVLWPIRSGLSALLKWRNVNKPMYFLTIRLSSSNIKNKKEVWNWHNFFYLPLCKGIPRSPLEQPSKTRHLANVGAALLLPA